MTDRPCILVLTRNPVSHTVIRFREVAESRDDFSLQVIDPHGLRLRLGDNGVAIEHDSLELDPSNTVVIPRIGSLSSEFSLHALELLELAGFPSLSPFAGLRGLRHKFSALAGLRLHGIPVPDSIMLRNQSDLATAVEGVGGYPLIVKFIRGSQGVGVVYADREDVVSSLLDALNLVQYDVLLQEFIPEAASWGTVRVFVSGGEARWAVKMTTTEGSSRSNLHAGGRPEAFELSESLALLVMRSCDVFGLTTAGVDLTQSEHGWIVMEINGSPGFQAIEEVHGVDVASHQLDSALKLLTV